MIKFFSCALKTTIYKNIFCSQMTFHLCFKYEHVSSTASTTNVNRCNKVGLSFRSFSPSPSLSLSRSMLVMFFSSSHSFFVLRECLSLCFAITSHHPFVEKHTKENKRERKTYILVDYYHHYTTNRYSHTRIPINIICFLYS